MSDGRLEFGTGRSSTRAELEGFGADPNLTRAQWEEGLRLVVDAWTNDTFEANGPTWTVPPRRHVHHGALRRDRRTGLRRSRRILRVVCAHRALEVARRYDAADCDILLCLLNPYKMSHESVMHSIELLGEHVIPALEG